MLKLLSGHCVPVQVQRQDVVDMIFCRHVVWLLMYTLTGRRYEALSSIMKPIVVPHHDVYID